ncbi:hypothetical protein [Pontibacter sp. G13]|uniref:hypothetical protein n=1 Tax=Pontibacter sp. G13 TaxID=3074898 RepID=UPI0028897A49|nr:hypothetical protein [Pontibacter sp. G13]WNJ20279.1 hypothetical protein RJD25_07350 [Pontibacter sp. G13]
MKPLILSILSLLFTCSTPQSGDKKRIDTGAFSIEVPANWHYKKQSGIDSFVGIIETEHSELHFDVSSMGYANPLVQSEAEYIESGQWKWTPLLLAKRSEWAAATQSKLEEIQIPEDEIQRIDGRWIATLLHRDTTKTIEIEIPAEILNYTCSIDTVDGYYRKIVQPKVGIKGTTGIYIQALNDSYNFNLWGKDLNPQEQAQAIEAFEGIQIRR